MPIEKDTLIINYLEHLSKEFDQVPSKEYAFPSDSLFQEVKNNIAPKETTSQAPPLFKEHTLTPSKTNFYNHYIDTHHPTWILVTMMVCVFLITITRYFNKKRLIQMFRAFTINRYINQLIRDGYVLLDRTSVLLMINFLLSLTFFAYFYFSHYLNLLKPQPSVFINILLGLSFFYLMKILLIKLLGFIFDNQENAYEHTLLSFLYSQITGIIILPVIILLYYSNIQSDSVLITSTIITTIAVYIYKIIRLALMSASKPNYSLFYLFLYLCTVEILPVLLFSKYLINNYIVV